MVFDRHELVWLKRFSHDLLVYEQRRRLVVLLTQRLHYLRQRGANPRELVERIRSSLDTIGSCLGNI